jgi:hypothetical protein
MARHVQHDRADVLSAAQHAGLVWLSLTLQNTHGVASAIVLKGRVVGVERFEHHRVGDQLAGGSAGWWPRSRAGRDGGGQGVVG